MEVSKTRRGCFSLISKFSISVPSRKKWKAVQDSRIYLKVLLKNGELGAEKNDSAVKNACCFSRAHEFGSQNPLWVVHNC